MPCPVCGSLTPAEREALQVELCHRELQRLRAATVEPPIRQTRPVQRTVRGNLVKGTMRTSLGALKAKIAAAGALLLVAVTASAQTTIGASAAEFSSPDHAAVLSDGTPALTGYQALLLPATADPVGGATLQVGTVTPKTAVAVVNPTTYRLTVSQLGISIPPCTVAQGACPAYRMVLLAVGPNGTSARGVASTSNPFAAASTASPPAPPGNIHVVP